MSKSITLKDIAREAGVHVSTVSRALDPDGQNTLTPEVVERVRRIAQQMGYRRNRLAYGLRTKRTMTVGILIPDIANTLFPPIVRGVESVLENAGYASILVNTDGDPEREDKLVNVLLERGVDGIIDAAVQRHDKRMIAVTKQGTPVVTVNREIPNSGIPSVVNDDEEGVRLALMHLYDMGHRRIANVAGPQDLSTGLTRLTAFNKFAQELNLDLPPAATVLATNYDEEEGCRCAELLLCQYPDCTAILCANDRLALGVFDHLAHLGLSCPDDISVTGFNDLPFLDRIPPGLTTIRVQKAGVGMLSAELLLKMMQDNKATIPGKTVVPVQLVQRNSVAPPKGH